MNVMLVFRINGVRLEVEIFKKDAVVLMNSQHTGRVYLEDGKWWVNGSQLQRYTDTIISKRLEAEPLLRWKLPEQTRQYIRWAKYDMDNNLLRLYMWTDDISFTDFEQALLPYLPAGDMLILLTCSRSLTAYLISN